MRKTAVILTSALILLSACGEDAKPGEPTEAEMKAVVGASIKADVDRRAIRPRAGMPAPKGFEGFSSFNKLECREPVAPATGWTCRFNMTFSINGNKMTKEHQGTFTRNDKGELSFTP